MSGVPLSVQVEIDHEAIDALWPGILHHVEELFAPRRVPEHCVDALRHAVLGILADFRDDIIRAVFDTASGTPKHVLRLGIVRSFQGDFARCALELERGHGEFPSAEAIVERWREVRPSVADGGAPVNAGPEAAA